MLFVGPPTRDHQFSSAGDAEGPMARMRCTEEFDVTTFASEGFTGRDYRSGHLVGRRHLAKVPPLTGAWVPCTKIGPRVGPTFVHAEKALWEPILFVHV